MPSKSTSLAAAIAATFCCVVLTGSTHTSVTPIVSAEAGRIRVRAARLYSAARYREARQLFIQAAEIAQTAGDTHMTSTNLNNAGACWLVEMQFRPALAAFNRARTIAEENGDAKALAGSLNNIASLYIHMGQPDQAVRAVLSAMRGPGRDISIDKHLRPQLRMQLAIALMGLHRYNEALPIGREAVAELIAQKNYDDAARALSSLGDESLKVNRLDEAEWALDAGWLLVRDNNANAKASILSGRARLRARQGRFEEAQVLFDRALAAPPGVTPRWKLSLDRAQFRLDRDDLTGAVADFRSARAVAARMRLDVVPADQDRVGLESGLSDVVEGLVEAGNRLASGSADPALLQETFDAAEQDRQWSLRALVPGMDDWRSRLPETYWESLVRYQALERAAAAQPGAEADRRVTAADDELKRMEAQAGQGSKGENVQSALQHVRSLLDAETVLFSFHVAVRGSWLWATDSKGTQVFPLPGSTELERQARGFREAVQTGSGSSRQLGAAFYNTLFAAVPIRFTASRKWLLEPDGPLYEVPFAALVVNAEGVPEYLIEKASLQSIPGALLLRKSYGPVNGTLLALGDAIYNGADPRYKAGGRHPASALPRLPNTAEELESCRRGWGAERTRLLTGRAADPDGLRAELRRDPAIVHFATHVVASPREFRTGLIALSLGEDGSMGVLGPREIVARPVRSALVVIDGCHSSQALALPGAGLMGLARAWIGAGAGAVLVTQWDIRDADSHSLMEAFYRALASRPAQGIASALREAQMAQLQRDHARNDPSRWAGYLLQGRSQ